VKFFEFFMGNKFPARMGAFDYFARMKSKEELKGEPILISKTTFNSLENDNCFYDGPFMDSMGEGEGEPYVLRQAFGILKNRRLVYCELDQEVEDIDESKLEIGVRNG
jgi:hypothetical protein